jgi:hypothetical protein
VAGCQDCGTAKGGHRTGGETLERSRFWTAAALRSAQDLDDVAVFDYDGDQPFFPL